MIGRLKEKKRLIDFIHSNSKACMIYGLRRIGKSFLIKNTLEESGCNYIYFECVQASTDANLRLFCSSLGISPLLPSATFLDAFRELSRREKDTIVVIDEYQNLHKKEDDINIDSLMQIAIDQCPADMKLILCGSHVSAMKKLLKEENPLFGRFDPVIHLQAMDYLDSALFYPDASLRDKISYYSVFGGCPYINAAVKAESGLKANITRLILPQDSLARNYIENLLFKELKKLDGINEILTFLANGKKNYSDIQSKLTGRSNGYAAERLSVLESMGVVRKDAPINDPDNKKRTRYEICDNLLRFYYAYVFPNRSAITILGEETFFDSYIAESLDTFISYRFEGITREYFSRLATAGKLPGILAIGTYTYDNPHTKKNGEFDVVLKYKDAYDAYEVKFLKEAMTAELAKEEKEKMEAIPSLNIRNAGFVSASGFDFAAPEGVSLITGKMLYDIS